MVVQEVIQIGPQTSICIALWAIKRPADRKTSANGVRKSIKRH
jgi:hypothetical protein